MEPNLDVIVRKLKDQAVRIIELEVIAETLDERAAIAEAKVKELEERLESTEKTSESTDEDTPA